MSNEIFQIHYICENYGLSTTEVREWIQVELIHPFNPSDLLFDREDLERIRLICELKNHCDPNIQSLEVMLHLIDQLNYLQKKLNENNSQG